MIYKKVLFACLLITLTVFSNTSGTLGNAKKDEYITFTLMNKEKLVINKNRLDDASIGNRIDNNRWTLSETDRILESIKGTWKPDKYIGFVLDGIYYSDLFECVDTLDEDYREDLYSSYDEKVSEAKENIPDTSISIKEYKDEYTNSNCILINNRNLSPVNITFSAERIADYYPSQVDETTFSSDIFVEYPVMYIKFFQRCNSEPGSYNYYPKDYEGATLVISSDHQFYYLFDGAFYSLKKV